MKLVHSLPDAGAELAGEGEERKGGGRGGGEGRSHCSFLKIREKCSDFARKSALILEKSAPFVYIYGLNFHLKCSFKSILVKNHRNISLRGPSFACRT